jgi:hypothetical protein
MVPYRRRAVDERDEDDYDTSQSDLQTAQASQDQSVSLKPPCTAIVQYLRLILMQRNLSSQSYNHVAYGRDEFAPRIAVPRLADIEGTEEAALANKNQDAVSAWTSQSFRILLVLWN